jgi:hypothetical protein
VREVLGENVLEVPVPENEEAVQALSTDRPHETFGEGVRTWCLDRVLMTLRPSARNTSSKLALNFVSRSRTRNLAARDRSERAQLRLRACCVTHCPTGLAVTPAR